MRIGITYDLKTPEAAAEVRRLGLPDDVLEEFDSPATIEALAAAIRSLGHETMMLGDGREFLEKVLADPPDLVFNFAEGLGISRSREARVPAVLEMLGIPFTGSDPLTLSVTLDKDCAKKLVAAAGVRVPAGVIVKDQWAMANGQWSMDNWPVIVKPAWEGSSKGIRNKCLVDRPEDLTRVLAEMVQGQRQPALVEEFIEGDELTVGILGNEAPEILGIMRVLPRNKSGRFLYSLEVKRDYKRQVEYECPAQLPAAVLKRVKESALTAFQALGCRDVARIDFRLRDGVPYFLEVNPIPGLNPEDSDLVIMSRLLGWDYRRLIGAILAETLKRYGLKA